MPLAHTYVHNGCFRNKAKSFLVMTTGGIVQYLSVAVKWLSCEKAAAGLLHDGLRFLMWSLVLKWFAFEYRSLSLLSTAYVLQLSFKEETRMSPFLPRKGSVHLSLGLILRTIVHNSGVVWQLCNWFTVQPRLLFALLSLPNSQCSLAWLPQCERARMQQSFPAAVVSAECHIRLSSHAK